MPSCPQSMGSCTRSFCCRVPAGIPGAVEAPAETPLGDALSSLSAAPVAQQWPRTGGPGRRGLWQEVAVGLSSLTLWLPEWPAVLPGEPAGGQHWGGVPAPPGKGSEPQGACGAPVGAGSWAADMFAGPETPPAVPIALASCLWPRLGSKEPDVSSASLPPCFLGGKLRPGSFSQGRGEFPWQWERGSGLPAAGDRRTREKAGH